MTATGELGDCRITKETPEGRGVGAAAMSLARHFRMALWTSEGLPAVGAELTVPIAFKLADPPAATEPDRP